MLTHQLDPIDKTHWAEIPVPGGGYLTLSLDTGRAGVWFSFRTVEDAMFVQGYRCEGTRPLFPGKGDDLPASALVQEF